jgi:hypothetical protein
MPANVEAVGESEQLRLPRSFEGARLGMTRRQLSVAVPEVGKVSSKTGRHKIDTIVASASGNPYVSRIEYRFFQGALQDIVIHYNGNRIPRGYEGLLDKLKGSYGRPAVHNMVEYDPKADVFFVKKTVWKDDTTAIVLSDQRRMWRGEEVSEIMVTMTDLALQEASQRQEDERRRKQEFAVPIPLEDQPAQRQESAESPSGRSRTASKS